MKKELALENEFKLRHESFIGISRIARFEAIIPHDWLDSWSYIRIDSENGHAILKIARDNIDGFIFVADETLPNVEEGKTVKCSESTIYAFFFYRLRYDKIHLLAFIALIITAIGTGIDGGLIIGKFGYVLFYFSKDWIFGFLCIALVLKILGLFVLFVKEFRK